MPSRTECGLISTATCTMPLSVARAASSRAQLWLTHCCATCGVCGWQAGHFLRHMLRLQAATAAPVAGQPSSRPKPPPTALASGAKQGAPTTADAAENVGAGAGIRLFLPIGAFQFDYGWPIVRDQDHLGSGGRFHFSIGATF